MNIVTSICIDEDQSGDHIHYPATLGAKSDQRRLIYWKCVTVFFATSVRCNPEARQIVYTNDQQPVIVKGVDIREYLTDLGVEIRYLPFQHFKPPVGYSKSFRNAYYKLDVMKALAVEEGDSILLDSDCVWTKPYSEIKRLLQSDVVLLYDVYKSYLKSHNSHYRTRIDMGNLYRKINPGYPKEEPVQFGGEFIAASSKNLKLITALLEEVYAEVIAKAKEQPLQIDKDRSIFDGDEFIASYVYNHMPLPYVDAKNIIGRIWNALKYSNASEQHLELTIWHVPSEKTQGIPLLFNKVMDKQSAFWTTPLSEFNIYLGKYLGIPKQLAQVRYLMLTYKVFEAVKRKLIKA